MESKTHAPRFSSFQRKRAPPKDDTSEEAPPATVTTGSHTSIPSREKDRDTKISRYAEREERKYEDDSRTHKNRDRTKHRERHHRSSRSHDRAHHDRRQRNEVDPSISRRPSHSQGQQAPVPYSNDSNQPYFIDRKGDIGNVSYGGLHRYSVPPYHRAGYGFVVGLIGNQRIDRAASSEKHMVIAPNGSSFRPERMMLSKRLTKLLAEPSRVIRPPPVNETSKQLGDMDYISVSGSSRKNQASGFPNRAGDDVAISIVEDEIPSWRSEASETESTENDLEPGGSESEIASQIKQRHSELLKQTKANPHRVQGWIELVDYQEDVMRLDRANSTERLNKAEVRNLSEIRISIYEQALRNTTADTTGHTALLIRLLKEGEQLWESRKVSDRWRQALEEFPDRIDLWTNYLDFAQSNFRGFRFDSAREYYLKCLGTLTKAMQRTKTAEDPPARLQNIQMYIFARLTRLVGEAGYHEQALAIWQALLEFTFFRPPTNANVPEEDRLGGFEDFWDSEVARVGEQGAGGWCNFTKDKPTLETKTDVSFSDAGHSNQISTFFELELSHIQSLKVPGRTADTAAEIDPYHVVLYSDISSYLPMLKANTSRLEVMASFLNFCGLPQLHTLDVQAFKRTDPFLQTADLRNISPKPTSKTESGEPSNNSLTQNLNSMAKFPLRNMQNTIQELFDGAFDPSCESRNLDFIRLVLIQIATVSEDETIMEYCIAYLARFYPEEAAKVAEALLKKCPSSLRLYNAYALAVRSSSNEIADRVLATALSMSQSLPEHIQRDTISLWHARVWEKLRAADFTASLALIVSMGNGQAAADVSNEVAGPGDSIHGLAALLKSRNNILEALEDCFANKDFGRGILYAECLALLLYLHHERNIAEALAVFHSTYARFSKLGISTSPASELMHQAQAKLLIYHGTHSRSFKPSIIRNAILESLRLFSDNTLFLTIYAANEARFRIDDRVRTLMDQIAGRSSSLSVVNWLFSIFTEMQRGEHGGSTSHSVRATFEHAVSTPNVKHNPSLWSSYVHFEINELLKTKNDEAIQRVKRVFFQGLTHLPWCKEYMMLAFAPGLIEVTKTAELRRVWNVMGEKEIRVFVDLEEAFRRVGDDNDDKMVSRSDKDEE